MVGLYINTQHYMCTVGKAHKQTKMYVIYVYWYIVVPCCEIVKAFLNLEGTEYLTRQPDSLVATNPNRSYSHCQRQERHQLFWPNLKGIRSKSVNKVFLKYD